MKYSSHNVKEEKHVINLGLNQVSLDMLHTSHNSQGKEKEEIKSLSVDFIQRKIKNIHSLKDTIKSG